eukprot:TRINITY_DN1713_c0_g1_i5.p1 TRINITY_DN1713_c0_g1~~TRINITY_DN1713_c0_g1_i5.p1  ORF type:complete len:241 (+),score=49.02 TRINITY_DN1713_c0_g1_i5:189-911(+)
MSGIFSPLKKKRFSEKKHLSVGKSKKTKRVSVEKRRKKEWKYEDIGYQSSTMSHNYIAFGRFILLNKLGKGGFGLIYSGIDINTGKGVAIKLEDANKARKKYLRLEYKTYQRLLSDWYHLPYYQQKCVPEVLHYGQEGGFRVLVIELLGVSLSSIFLFHGKNFSLITTCYLAIRMLDSVEFFHSKGLIHRDIKPANFVTGRGERSRDIFLIDFGLAMSYLDENGDHIPSHNNAKFKSIKD